MTSPVARSVSRLAGLLPPHLRRAASGFWLDIKSLPSRVGDPARRQDPWQTVHNVGGGDYRLAGQEGLRLLTTFADLAPTDDVLDIGCGTGRMAAALSPFLTRDARYVGFDVSRAAIASSIRRFAVERPDFAFLEADVTNGEYRPNGATAEADYRFPAQDQTIDVVFAMSVFSHMRMTSIVRYLREAKRVIRRSGRFAFTAYAVTPERVARPERGEGSKRFTLWEDGCYVIDKRSPERAIAHPLVDLEQACAAADLELAHSLRGTWLGAADYDGYQDLFVVRPK